MEEFKIKNKELFFLLNNLPKLKRKIEKKYGIKEDYIENKEKLEEIKKKVSKYKDKLSKKELDKLNYLKLKKRKHLKEERYFVITELGHKPEELYDYENLADFTEEHYNFQKKEHYKSLVEISKRDGKYTREEKIKNKKELQKRYGKKYDKLFLYDTWFRFIENKQIRYGSLASLESWVIDKVSNKISKFIDKNIPYIIQSSWDRESDSKYFSLDLTTKAMGREEELESLKREIRNNFENQMIEIITQKLIIGLKGCIFKKNNYRDNQISIYIPDLETAKMLKSKNFLNNVENMEQPFKYIKKRFKQILEEIHFKDTLNQMYYQNKSKFKKEEKEC